MTAGLTAYLDLTAAEDGTEARESQIGDSGASNLR
jgi:hypothetical protein